MPGKNEYLPIPSVVQKIIKHTPEEWTFRFTYRGPVKPGQFFQISIPKVGECPISVSGIGADHVDLTLRCVGKVTDWLFENVTEGDSLFIRGPYGNGFDVELYGQNEVVIVAGGTAVSPIRGVVQYLCRTDHPQDCHLIAGFKNPDEGIAELEKALKDAGLDEYIAAKQKALDDLVLAKFDALTDEEIKHLLFDCKWMPRLYGDINAEIDRILNDYASRVVMIAKRYEHTLVEIEDKTAKSREAVRNALERMGYIW